MIKFAKISRFFTKISSENMNEPIPERIMTKLVCAGMCNENIFKFGKIAGAQTPKIGKIH